MNGTLSRATQIVYRVNPRTSAEVDTLTLDAEGPVRWAGHGREASGTLPAGLFAEIVGRLEQYGTLELNGHNAIDLWDAELVNDGVMFVRREYVAVGFANASPIPRLLNRNLIVVDTDSTARTALATALRLKLAHRIAPVRHLASTLVLLGLIGTIIGFIIALSGVDPAAVTEASAIGPMVATLLHGMSMALFKTLVGSVLNVWLMVDYRLLEAGATHVLTHTVEIGERDAAA